MATVRRETKRKLNRLTIARIEVAILFTVLVLIGFAGGILVGTKTAERKQLSRQSKFQLIRRTSYQQTQRCTTSMFRSLTTFKSTYTKFVLTKKSL